MLGAIRIVLVNTSHPGNIGAAARAMKTMGIENLYLVNPLHFPHHQATEMAAGADDVLQNASVVGSLADAIADCTLVMGTSARQRHVAWPFLEAKEIGEPIRAHAASGSVALVFGRERTGLTNEELALCHYHVWIPTSPDFTSLNVAAAVQVLTYEVYGALRAGFAERLLDSEELPAPQVHLNRFYERLWDTLWRLRVLNEAHFLRYQQRLYRLFNRAQMNSVEINILQGILSAIQRKLAHHEKQGELC
ncbi:MAG: hypothetical protein A3J38_03125 [Gammaproteobacteria bacterium RIFCSPHIGHO2_12_FULL_45_9]|nr:MAG: hypothetical protein A3J38_03125 [Gammaproteobacteria bacterium RIFCSPHIGHO2_12_FULL_45_9]